MEKIKSVEDIKNGYLVRLRNGRLYMCVQDSNFNKYLLYVDDFEKRKNSTFFSVAESLSNYNGLKGSIIEDDIVEVYGFSHSIFNALSLSIEDRDCLYEERKKMTIEEIEKELGYKIEIVE